MEKNSRIDKVESDGAASPSDEEKNIQHVTKAPLDIEDPDEGLTEEERAAIVSLTAQRVLSRTRSGSNATWHRTANSCGSLT